MIEVKRLNDTMFMINPFQIETIEETPDTVIVLQSGRKLVVKEKGAEIERKFMEFIGNSVKLGILKSREG